MADTNDTKKDSLEGTRYVPLGEYDQLLKSCSKLEKNLVELEQKLAEKVRIIHRKKRFESAAVMLALWGSTALVLSECDCRGNSSYISVDAGDVADAGIYESEESSESKDGCYGPKAIGELKQHIGKLETKLEECRMKNEELSDLLKDLPKKDKPVTCPPVKECPYIKQY